jgi:DNA adenine methylase
MNTGGQAAQYPKVLTSELMDHLGRAPLLPRRFATKAPFPWFGGKSQAAPLIWQLLGDVEHYCEPFAGSLAVLLNRPHPCNRSYYSETVNDSDGLLCNAWRSVQLSPDATAEAASWPVMEADKSARQIALLRWRETEAAERIAGDPAFHDPIMGGWWLWAVAVQIGAFAGDGAWTVDPATGRIIKQARGSKREHGVSRDLPHLTVDGRGVNGPTMREPGVSRDLPHLANDGQGVNNQTLREPGVTEPPKPDDDEQHYHPTTMPKLRAWFALLSARLRHVRVLNGDWTRLCTVGASHTLMVRQGGHAGLFLDPPYAGDVRASGLYAADSGSIAAAVRTWALKAGEDPHNRIVIAGYDTEHSALEAAGWRAYEWFLPDSLLRGGMGSQQHRERLWASPHCLAADTAPQLDLFDTSATDPLTITPRRRSTDRHPHVSTSPEGAPSPA